jgi:hypothetical protein
LPADKKATLWGDHLKTLAARSDLTADQRAYVTGLMFLAATPGGVENLRAVEHISGLTCDATKTAMAESPRLMELVRVNSTGSDMPAFQTPQTLWLNAMEGIRSSLTVKADSTCDCHNTNCEWCAWWLGYMCLMQTGCTLDTVFKECIVSDNWCLTAVFCDGVCSS